MTKYYPLVDADSNGLDKVPMFPAHRIADALSKCNFALAEITPHQYVLMAVKPDGDPSQYRIRCPMCGKAMTQTAPYRSEHLLGEYACENCN